MGFTFHARCFLLFSLSTLTARLLLSPCAALNPAPDLDLNLDPSRGEPRDFAAGLLQRDASDPFRHLDDAVDFKSQDPMEDGADVNAGGYADEELPGDLMVDKNGEWLEDGGSYDVINEEKRPSRFRTDLGKRLYRADLGKRRYRADLGKRLQFRTDLGKRLYRADLGKRLYRADLGKRLYRADLGKRLYRADLGKRRYRADLGKRGFEEEIDSLGGNRLGEYDDNWENTGYDDDKDVEDKRGARFRSDLGKREEWGAAPGGKFFGGADFGKRRFRADLG